MSNNNNNENVEVESEEQPNNILPLNGPLFADVNFSDAVNLSDIIPLTETVDSEETILDGSFEVEQEEMGYNASNLKMFQGCTDDQPGIGENYCFLSHKSKIKYPYKNRNEWCNVYGENVIMNKFTDGKIVSENKAINTVSSANNIDNNLDNFMAFEEDGMCAKNNCGNDSECTPICRQLNCINCH